MNDFYNAYKNVISSPLYDPMIKMAGLLKDHLGVNHFWYYKITQEGQYSYFGTHRGWNEYCLEHDLIRHCPNIRHPSTQPLGIHFISAGAPPEAKNLLTLAWEKFRVNFNFNLVTGNSQRIESFGFASHFNDPWADQRLLNELPLLRHFTETLLKRHRHFFQMLDEASVNAAANLGSQFFERPKIHSGCQRPHLAHTRAWLWRYPLFGPARKRYPKVPFKWLPRLLYRPRARPVQKNG